MASYELSIKPSAVKELKKLPLRDRRRTVDRIFELSSRPRPVGCEKLSGRERYRVRQGDYRVLYSVDDEAREVTVFKIGHRGEVYR